MVREARASLIVSNDLSELARVGTWVNAWSRERDVPPGIAKRIDLCAAEAVINIISHAYTDHSPHRISLRLDRRRESFSLEIEDDGMPFDPGQAIAPEPATSLEHARVGGLGIPMIKGFSEELWYHRAEGRNHLRLVFRPRSSDANE